MDNQEINRDFGRWCFFHVVALGRHIHDLDISDKARPSVSTSYLCCLTNQGPCSLLSIGKEIPTISGSNKVLGQREPGGNQTPRRTPPLKREQKLMQFNTVLILIVLAWRSPLLDDLQGNGMGVDNQEINRDFGGWCFFHVVTLGRQV